MYYLQVAPVLLPWAKNRPATRKRWVDGVGTEACPGKSFFQKNLDAATPEWVQRQRVHHMDHDNIYPLVNDARTLVWLAQTATLEIHVPQWKLASDGVPQNPDRLVGRARTKQGEKQSLVSWFLPHTIKLKLLCHRASVHP